VGILAASLIAVMKRKHWGRVLVGVLSVVSVLVLAIQVATIPAIALAYWIPAAGHLSLVVLALWLLSTGSSGDWFEQVPKST
jgi:hypothetical protein